MLMVTERFDFMAKQRKEEQGAVALVLKGFRAGQSPGGLGLGNALQLPKEDIANVVWLLRAPEASTV